MCFSFEASITTVIISWSIGFFLLSRTLDDYQRKNVIFLLIFSSMQIADSILWYINMKKNRINYIVTSVLIPFILGLQIFYNIFIINYER